MPAHIHSLSSSSHSITYSLPPSLPPTPSYTSLLPSHLPSSPSLINILCLPPSPPFVHPSLPPLPPSSPCLHTHSHSGVIAKQYKEIRDSIRRIVVNTLFDPAAVSEYFSGQKKYAIEMLHLGIRTLPCDRLFISLVCYCYIHRSSFWRAS